MSYLGPFSCIKTRTAVIDKSCIGRK